MEPPQKKVKTETMDDILKFVLALRNSKKHLQSILSDDIYKPVPTIKFYAGQIKDPKDISKAISVLNEKVPLKEFQHLKRVKAKKILLCPTHFLKGMTSIQEFIDIKAPELSDIFEFFKEINVPLYGPKTRSQFNECIKYWSCSFHPNKYLEDLTHGTVFSSHQRTQHKLFMEMVFEVSKYYGNFSLNAAVVVDPKIWSVVAVSFDNRTNNLLQHAAMLAIDNVARTQNGGVWDSRTGDEYNDSNGIDSDLLVYLKEKFSTVSFGAREFIEKNSSEESSHQDSPYLCTGYYIYLLREPCLMCSMGLVHARVKRVFYCFDSENGALNTKTKLQTVTSLNHHFEVFTGFI